MRNGELTDWIRRQSAKLFRMIRFHYSPHKKLHFHEEQVPESEWLNLQS